MKKISDILWLDIPNKFKELTVSDICDDSRKATEGCMFIALSGSLEDGNKYINNAIASGAKFIILHDKNIKSETIMEDKNSKSIFIYVENPRIALAKIVPVFFQSKFENIIAVTGTNGKSSTVDIVRQIWIHEGRNAASIGTLGVISNKKSEKLQGNLTSPGTIELHKIFHKLSNDGISDVAIEASSHGIEQHRLDFIPFKVCAFTNISQDHLDYHKTMENYCGAKEKLFSELALQETIFIINADDEYSNTIIDIAKKRNVKYVTYGYKSDDIKIISIATRKNDQKVKISFFENEFSFSLPLYGKFQVYNSLCAAGICYSTGIKIDSFIKALEKIKPISGRLEHVADFRSAKIYIDYAHTPDALKNAILSLRDHKPRRIITVFGCGGDRDQQKRKLMGEVSANFSDIVIVTDDNPRNEDPVQIRKMILEGCSLRDNNKTSIFEIGDRKTAIEYGIDSLSEEDVLLIAGKGHENYQQHGTNLIHFSDKEIILGKVLK